MMADAFFSSFVLLFISMLGKLVVLEKKGVKLQVYKLSSLCLIGL